MVSVFPLPSGLQVHVHECVCACMCVSCVSVWHVKCQQSDRTKVGQKLTFVSRWHLL